MVAPQRVVRPPAKTKPEISPSTERDVRLIIENAWLILKFFLHAILKGTIYSE